jgi:hypothetical protein
MEEKTSTAAGSKADVATVTPAETAPEQTAAAEVRSATSGGNSIFKILILLLLLFIALVLAVIAGYLLFFKPADGGNTNLTPTPGTTVPAVTGTGVTPTSGLSPVAGVTGGVTPSTAATHTVKAFFVDDIKFNTPDMSEFLTSVNRQTTRTDVATFAMEQVIAGPTAQERANLSLREPIFLSGVSNCSGKDFTLSVSSGIATIRFCKPIVIHGDAEEWFFRAAVLNTLKQFPTVQKVKIYISDGSCWSDMSGQDICGTGI